MHNPRLLPHNAYLHSPFRNLIRIYQWHNGAFHSATNAGEGGRIFLECNRNAPTQREHLISPKCRVRISLFIEAGLPEGATIVRIDYLFSPHRQLLIDAQLWPLAWSFTFQCKSMEGHPDLRDGCLRQKASAAVAISTNSVAGNQYRLPPHTLDSEATIWIRKRYHGKLFRHCACYRLRWQLVDVHCSASCTNTTLQARRDMA